MPPTSKEILNYKKQFPKPEPSGAPRNTINPGTACLWTKDVETGKWRRIAPPGLAPQDTRYLLIKTAETRI